MVIAPIGCIVLIVILFILFLLGKLKYFCLIIGLFLSCYVFVIIFALLSEATLSGYKIKFTDYLIIIVISLIPLCIIIIMRTIYKNIKKNQKFEK
jgi:hypothetical protein